MQQYSATVHWIFPLTQAKVVNVARLTQLKSELRDAERRQSVEIARQTEEIARLSQDVTWFAGLFSQDVKDGRWDDDGSFTVIILWIPVNSEIYKDRLLVHLGIHGSTDHWGESPSAAAENSTWHAESGWPRKWLHASVTTLGKWSKRDGIMGSFRFTCEDWCGWNFCWRFCV